MLVRMNALSVIEHHLRNASACRAFVAARWIHNAIINYLNPLYRKTLVTKPGSSLT
jgi:hypothetical protein